MNQHSSLQARLFWAGLFSVAFGFVEAAVVVYLRSLYYPHGFVFPLKMMSQMHVVVELAREFSTLLMLLTVGALAGQSRWAKFAFFALAFGVWDIFYYIWLKVLLDWPSSMFDWDILFLLPVPWIGPVIAPVLISLILIGGGVGILAREYRGSGFHPPRVSAILAMFATLLLLYSFMMDTDATMRLLPPRPYHYELLIAGCFLYGVSAVVAFRPRVRQAF